MSRRFGVLLIVSLTINVFLIGAIAGGVYRWRHGAGIGLTPGWRARAIEALPDGTGDRLRAGLRQTALDSRALIRLGQRSRQDAATLFTAPDYDAAAVTQALRRARVTDFIVRSRIEDTVVAFAGKLPIAERQALAKALRRGPLRPPAPKPRRRI